MRRAHPNFKLVLVTVLSCAAALVWPGHQTHAQFDNWLEIGLGITAENRSGQHDLGKAQHRLVDTNGDALSDNGTLRTDSGFAALIEIYPLERLGIGYRYGTASDTRVVSVDASRQAVLFGETLSDVHYTESAHLDTSVLYLVWRAIPIAKFGWFGFTAGHGTATYTYRQRVADQKETETCLFIIFLCGFPQNVEHHSETASAEGSIQTLGLALDLGGEDYGLRLHLEALRGDPLKLATLQADNTARDYSVDISGWSASALLRRTW